MSLQLEEIASHVVDVDETEFLVDVVLGDVDVEVIVAILVQTRLLRAGTYIACHRIGYDSPSCVQMFSDNFCQCWMFPIRNIVKHWNTSTPAGHTEHSIDLSRENRAFAKFLPSQPRLIDLNRSWQFKVG